MAEEKRGGPGAWKFKLTPVEVNDLVAMGMMGTLALGLMVVLALQDKAQAVGMWLAGQGGNLVLR